MPSPNYGLQFKHRPVHAREAFVITDFHPAGLTRAGAAGHERHAEGLDVIGGARGEAEGARGAGVGFGFGEVEGDDVSPVGEVGGEWAALNFNSRRDGGQRRGGIKEKSDRVPVG